MKLGRKPKLNDLYRVVFFFFGPTGKHWWPPWPLIGWYISYYSSGIIELNLMKLGRKQILNVLPISCFWCRSKNKDNCAGRSVNKGGTFYSGVRYVALWTPCCIVLEKVFFFFPGKSFIVNEDMSTETRSMCTDNWHTLQNRCNCTTREEGLMG